MSEPSQVTLTEHLGPARSTPHLCCPVGCPPVPRQDSRSQPPEGGLETEVEIDSTSHAGTKVADSAGWDGPFCGCP